MTKKITLSKGGTKERTVKVSEIIVPDLWHVALRQIDKEDKEAILATWHLAHDLLNHIRETE